MPTTSRSTTKCLVRPLTETKGSDGEGSGVEAAELMVGGDGGERRVLLLAAGDAVGAAGGEAAGGRQVGELGDAARDDAELRAPLAHPRHAAEEALRVGVLRVAEDLAGGPALDDLARVHHGHAVGDLVHDPEVVRDQDHAHPELLAERGDQLEDLRLDRHVERGRGLVCDQQLRLA